MGPKQTTIETKRKERGLSAAVPIRLDTAVFLKNTVRLSENARKVLERRYLKKDASGAVLETPEKMFERVARHVARAEEKYGNPAQAEQMARRFYEMMTSFAFLPNSPR